MDAQTELNCCRRVNVAQADSLHERLSDQEAVAGWQPALRRLLPSVGFVGFCAPILNKLDGEAARGGQEEHVNSAALVEQKFLNQPDDEKE